MRLSRIDVDAIEAALQENRARLAQIISDKGDAHSGGDVFHDPEFSKLEQEERIIRSRVEQLEGILDGAEIIEQTQTQVVDVGLVVRLNSGEYLITGSASVPFEGKDVISAESPLGRELIGKSVGEDVYYSIGGSMLEEHIHSITAAKAEPKPHAPD